MYLHENKENFQEMIELVSTDTGRAAAVIEKDYYVTLILRLLSEQLSNVVFKGGTSLSKGYHAINRFSEDIDITFDEHIGEARRKKLKNQILKGISEELCMPISNWESTQSDRDYNAYYFSYESVWNLDDDRMLSSVKLETALGSYAFPTEKIKIGNYIGEYFRNRGREDLAEKFRLDEFEMKVQALERTYIDKIFALCDYYIQNKSKRYSRHLYDIYKLTQHISFDANFEKLYYEIREHRKTMKICPSAGEGVDVTKIIREFCDADFYREDYETITSYFSADYFEPEPRPNAGGTIGIDVGIKAFYSDSNGNTVSNPRYLERSMRKLIREQRRLSRKQKDSHNRGKQRLRVARVHEKIANQRNDFLQKQSTMLVRENQTICIEDLNVKGMIRNHKLAKSIASVSWAKFFEMLEYKASWYGNEIQRVPTMYPSSQTCSSCGYRNPRIKNLSIRIWECPKCHAVHDRDTSASINILKKALQMQSA